MPIDKETLTLVTLLGGPLSTISYVLYKGADYLGPRITMKELLPTLPGQEGKLFLPRLTARPDLVRGLWEEIKLAETKANVPG